jgi:hypothetical protein
MVEGVCSEKCMPGSFLLLHSTPGIEIEKVLVWGGARQAYGHRNDLTGCAKRGGGGARWFWDFGNLVTFGQVSRVQVEKLERQKAKAEGREDESNPAKESQLQLKFYCCNYNEVWNNLNIGKSIF